MDLVHAVHIVRGQNHQTAVGAVGPGDGVQVLDSFEAFNIPRHQVFGRGLGSQLVLNG